MYVCGMAPYFLYSDGTCIYVDGPLFVFTGDMFRWMDWGWRPTCIRCVYVCGWLGGGVLPTYPYTSTTHCPTPPFLPPLDDPLPYTPKPPHFFATVHIQTTHHRPPIHSISSFLFPLDHPPPDPLHSISPPFLDDPLPAGAGIHGPPRRAGADHGPLRRDRARGHRRRDSGGFLYVLI